MAETKSGLLDTTVVIDLDVISPELLPDEASIIRGLEQILTVVAV